MFWLPHALVLAIGCFLLGRFRLMEAGAAVWPIAGWALLAAAAGAAASALFRGAVSRTGQPAGEALRWTVLLAAGILLTLPYARPERIGAGDAQDYAEHVADFIRQVKGGVFPVLVGQSHFAYNGAFNPIRTAPYLEYAGGLLWALSFGRLDAFAVQNLEIILSLVAAGFSAYLCLQRLAPRQPTACLLLAFLYISSPGVLALVYEGDMIPSWLTLPYLPIMIYLVVRVADEGPRLRWLVGMAIAGAALWWAHAPIAMWTCFIAVPVVALRLVRPG
ncbi:MAG TPA: hypothetical protein VHV47_04935, partial [Opitutaceae bacterium]|nr:hypothetical protein [Opitutaceae bacterium]